MANLHKLFKKIKEEEGIRTNSFYENSIYYDTKTRQKHYKKTTNQFPYRFKTSKQTISKLNPAMNKKDITS